MGVAGRQEDNSLKRYLRGASMRLQGMKEVSGSQLLGELLIIKNIGFLYFLI